MRIRPYLHQGLRYGGALGGRHAYCGPRSVQIGITDFCNFGCLYCTIHSDLMDGRFDAGAGREQYRVPRMHPEVMPLDTYKRLILDLAKIQCRKVSLIGFGEPFLHREIMEIIDCSAGRVELQIVSNGSLLTPDRAERLVGAVKHLNVSIDAGTPSTHGKIHRPAKPVFETIKKSLLWLRAAKERTGARFPEVSLSTVLCRENYLEIDRIFELALELGVKTVDFSLMGAVRQTEHLQVRQEDVRKREFVERLERSREAIRCGGLQTNLFSVLKTYDVGGARSRKAQEALPCYVGWFFLRVFPNGDVHPCCGCDRILGNIRELSIREVWKAPGFAEFRREARTLHKKGRPVKGCRCHDCGETHFNLEVYRRLHPLARRK